MLILRLISNEHCEHATYIVDTSDVKLVAANIILCYSQIFVNGILNIALMQL